MMSRKLVLLLQETNRKDAALEIVREKFGSLIFCSVGSFFHGVDRINFSDTDKGLNKSGGRKSTRMVITWPSIRESLC